MKLFTVGLLRSPEEGRALVEALGEHLPSWLPHRYGVTEPLRHVYDPNRFDHFWSQLDYSPEWRNERRSATGSVHTRVGPYDVLSWIELSGEQVSELALDGLGRFVQAVILPLGVTYGAIQLYHPDDEDDWARVRTPTRTGEPFLAVSPTSLKRCLPDLFWGNVFGPPYVELFGAERVRSAPAAVVRELRPGYFYLQLTEDIKDVQEDRPGFVAVRDAVKEHLGADCFYDKGATTPRRAPRFVTAAEEGLWKPVKGTRMTDELRALLAKAPSDES